MAIKTKRFIGTRKNCSCSMPGVWRAAFCCDGAIVILHSPRACAHLVRSMETNSQYRMLSYGKAIDHHYSFVPLISSQMEEKHSIFGGTKRLYDCIRFAVEKYHPQCIVIGNSCIAGVIGDDVEAVSRDARQEFGIPIITVDCYGFLDGEYYQGYFEAAKKLAEEFIKPQQHIQKTAVLIGDGGGPWGHYAREISRLLSELGIKIIGQFPGYMPIRELSSIGRSYASIILGSNGQSDSNLIKLADLLQDRFDIIHLPSGLYPIGWKSTHEWLIAMGKLFSCENKVQPLLAEENQRLTAACTKFLSVTAGKTAILCIGRSLLYFNPATIFEIIDRLNLQLKEIILLEGGYIDSKDYQMMLDTVRQCTDAPIYKNKLMNMEQLDADIILTTHELQNYSIKQIFLPMLPKIGTIGMIELMQEIYRTLCSRNNHGGITYAW